MASLDIAAGSVAFVTGAGRGIGRAIAHALSGAGAHCVVADKDAANAASVAAEIGGSACPLDVTDESAVAAAIAGTAEKFGRLDILINNAAINMSTSDLGLKPFWEIGTAEWDFVLRVNMSGTFFCSRAAAPIMRSQGSGRIVNLASTVVALGAPNYLHYVASKGAIIGMTHSMAREIGPFGVTVNAISPGPVQTEVPRRTQSPQQYERLLAMQCIPAPIGTTDLVGTVLFLCSPAARMITGQVITIDGGAVLN